MGAFPRAFIQSIICFEIHCFLVACLPPPVGEAKAAGIFIVYLTTCANDICKDKKKQTVTAQDILAACGELELDDVKPQLEEFLAALRAHESGKRKAASAPVEEPAAQRPAGEAAPAQAEDEDSDDAPLESLVTVTAAQ